MWCPKCKYEYRAGKKVCADCGCKLVESLDDIADTEDEMDDGTGGKFNNYDYGNADDNLEYENTADDMSDENKGYSNLESSDMEGHVIDDVIDDVDDLGDEGAEPKTAEPAYVPKRVRYEDNKSSAYTFFLVGGVGAVLVILHIAGVFDFNLTPTSKLLTNTVMGALFVIFIIVGIVSAKNSVRYKREALAEEALTENIKSFIHELYTTDGIDNACGVTDTSEAYEKWDLRYHFLEKQIAGEYPELAADYLEYITDMIYNELYEE